MACDLHTELLQIAADGVTEIRQIWPFGLNA